MVGLGTLINTGAVIVGGIAGMLFGKLLKERHQEGIQIACGVSTMFIGVAGAVAGMVKIDTEALTSYNSMLVVACLVLGTLIGELINIEGLFERFGEWLKRKTGNAKDQNFVNGFVTSSLTVCIGAMAVIGSIEDGVYGDYTILLTKSVLDFIIVMVMASSLGKGCIFSALPILVLEGGMTLLAKLLSPLVTDAAMFNLSVIGSILIFCVGINLTFGKKIRVANMLPALIFAVVIAFLPFASWFS